MGLQGCVETQQEEEERCVWVFGGDRVVSSDVIEGVCCVV